MAHEGMKAYREVRKLMGFRQTSAYIPNNKISEFSAYVERLKAERMMEIIQLPGNSTVRLALAERNFVDAPDPGIVKAFMQRYATEPEIVKLGRETIKCIEIWNYSFNVAKQSEELPREEVIKLMSVAVANNHMAAALWREMLAIVKQVTNA